MKSSPIPDAIGLGFMAITGQHLVFGRGFGGGKKVEVLALSGNRE